MDFLIFKNEGNIFSWNLPFFMDFLIFKNEGNSFSWNLPFLDFSNL